MYKYVTCMSKKCSLHRHFNNTCTWGGNRNTWAIRLHLNLTPNKFHRHKGRLLYMYEQGTHITIKATVYRTSANQMFPISSITSIKRFVFLIWVTKIRRFICWLAPDWRHQWSLPWWHFFQLCSPKHWGERYWSVFPCVWPGRFTKHCRGFLSFLEDKIFFSLHMDDK